MEKACEQCGRGFEITDADLESLERLAPVFSGGKFAIPLPSLCPLCRQQRRLLFRNERKLYQRKCSMTGRSLVSTYAEDAVFPVYDQDIWWGDSWDGCDYGRDFDFSKSLTQQLKELFLEVPRISLYTVNVENSYYTNFALNQKNVYLVFGAGDNEDCMYGKFIVSCKDVLDSLTVFNCEFCYEGVSSERCYGCRFFVNCRGCRSSLMIEECSNCQDCIACFGLRNKQYCIMNKQYSKEDYEKVAAEYEYLTHEKIDFLKDQLALLKKDLPRLASHIYASEDCSGESVYNSKNCHAAFDANNCEDCRYVYFIPNSVGSMDACFCAPEGIEFSYNMCSTVGLSNSMSLYLGGYGDRNFYSIECHHCNDVFGCIGLKHKRYCILNKQYSREEYEELVPRIIDHMKVYGEWGEYLDPSLSAFAYNETIAQEYFPMTKAEVLARGWAWKGEADDIQGGEKGSVAAAGLCVTDLCENIREVDDAICEEVFVCESSRRTYKIVKKELEFYRRMKLPIPRLHSDERHFERLKMHDFKELFQRDCVGCGKIVDTTYGPEREEKVCCEECYLKEVY